MTVIEACVVVIIIAILVAACVAGGAIVFMWSWNAFMPVLWHAAPHIGFAASVGAIMLIGFIRGLIHHSTTVHKKS